MTIHNEPHKYGRLLIGMGRMSKNIAKNRDGLALVWIIVTMTMISAVGAAMLSLYSTSTSSQLDINSSRQVVLTAESGRQFFLSEYQNESTEINKNTLLDTLHGNKFNLVKGENNRYQIDVTSFFYRVSVAISSGTLMRAKFIGDSGFTVPTSGEAMYLRLEGNSNIYNYTAVIGPTGDGTYFFFLNSTATASVYTSVYPVVNSSIGSSVSSGGTLTLDTGLGAVFPSKNGMFIIEKSEIKNNLPVATKVLYQYEYRNGDQLVNIQKGPRQSGFTTIDSTTSTYVEVSKFVDVAITGSVGTESAPLGKLENTYQIAIPSTTSTPGLKSFFSFDDAGTPGKDDYGTHDATWEGSGSPSQVTGMVGSAIQFTGSTGDYYSTDFNPEYEVGDNNSFTITFWERPDTVAVDPDIQVVVGSQNTSTSRLFGVGIVKDSANIGDSSPRWAWAIGNISETDDSDLPVVDEGAWQHVTYVFDYVNLKVQIYINGVKEYDKAFSGTADLPGVEIGIGAMTRQDGTAVYEYDGTLDELAVLSTTLDYCDVDAIFNVPSDPPCVFGCDAEAYYPFNGNAQDKSGAGSTWNGSPWGADLTTDRCGRTDAAYEFDGNDYISIGLNPVDDINGGTADAEAPFSIAFWAKTDTTSANQSAMGSFVDTPRERFYFYIWNGEWSWGYGGDLMDNSLRPSATADVWTHYGIVFDGSPTYTMRLYLNGSETQDTFNSGGSSDLPDYGMIIGGRNQSGSSNLHFQGDIDEVYIWKSAKTQTEMEDLYNDTKP